MKMKMKMKNLILVMASLLTLASCQKDAEFVKNFGPNGSLTKENVSDTTLNITTQVVKNELPRTSSYVLNQDGLKVNAVLDSAQFYDLESQQRTFNPVNGNPNFSRAFMEDKPNDREYDMNDAVVDFRYRTTSRSVGGGRGPGNTVPHRTHIDIELQAAGVGASSPEIGFGVSLFTLSGIQIFNPDSLISEVRVNNVSRPFTVRNNVIRVVAFNSGHKTQFWNTPKWRNPNKNFNQQTTLAGVNLTPYAGNYNYIDSVYTQPLPSDKVNIEIIYNRNAVDNYFRQYGSIVVYHLDPFFTASNFRQFRGDIPFSLIVPTNTAWSSEFIDLRYTYPNLVPTYTNFTNRVDSLAYMR